MKRILCASIILAFASASDSRADAFGSGANSFEIEFVTVGPATSPLPDQTIGAVPYEYRIGRYEISEQMIDKANILGGLGITKDTRGPTKPATGVSWFEAAQFVNWLNNSTGSSPAYKFDDGGNFQLWTPTDAGYDPANLFRNLDAKYFLPNANEWFEAAYYDPKNADYYFYPTGSSSPPDGIDFDGDPDFEAVFRDGAIDEGNFPYDVHNVGVLSPYGTAGQAGNVWEWLETELDLVNDAIADERLARGSYWNTSKIFSSARPFPNGIYPGTEGDFLGFRVASVAPEPNVVLYVVLVAGGMVLTRRRLDLLARGRRS
jgi:sulfatase modifying factor 1